MSKKGIHKNTFDRTDELFQTSIKITHLIYIRIRYNI